MNSVDGRDYPDYSQHHTGRVNGFRYGFVLAFDEVLSVKMRRLSSMAHTRFTGIRLGL